MCGIEAGNTTLTCPVCAVRVQGVNAVFKRIDTCAAEFFSPTAYFYSTYDAPLVGARCRVGGYSGCAVLGVAN